MTQTASYSELLKVKGFQAFLWMQFLNAFNDNVYKLAVSLLAVSMAANSAHAGAYLSAAGFIFVAPFLLFSPYAGQLADRWEKRTVVIVTKAVEIAAMLLAVFALQSGSIVAMLVVLFFTATQAALFSPAKYGIVPELVEEKYLARANGLLEMSTFVAIILGTIGGSYLVSIWKHQPVRIGLFLIVVSLLGTLVSFRIRRTPAPASRRAFSWNPCAGLALGFRRLFADRTLLLSVLGTTYFWFLGALFQMLLLLFGKQALHATEAQTGLLMASLAIGIGTGSMAAGRLSGDTVEPGMVPLGALGMALGSFVLAFAAHSLPAAAVTLVAVGFMGGIFIVPLNAIQQHRPGANEKGLLLSTANIVNTLGVMLASAAVWLLDDRLHFTAAHIVALSAGATLLAALYSFRCIPRFTARFVLTQLTRLPYAIRVTGQENVPNEGPALLVANHVSYVDGFMIGAALPRFVRFMVNETWYRRFAPVFRLFHAIPVPAGHRRAVVVAIDRARAELQKGHVVCIFAEGALTQTGNIGEFHRGLEHIVKDLDVPVVPVHLGGLWGSIFSLAPRRSLLLNRAVSVTFGQPLRDPAAHEVRQAVTELAAGAAHAAIAPNGTLARRFVQSAKRNWSHRAFTDSTGPTLSYGQALTAAILLARRIQRSDSGGKEQMIGVMLPASTAAAVVNLGIVLSGRVPVNLNFTAGAESLESAIAQCALRTVFTSSRFLEKAQLPERREFRHVEAALAFPLLAKAAAFLLARVLPVRFLIPRATLDSLAAVLFSSGSTGSPKGIMLSHRNLISNAESVHQLFPVTHADTIAGVLPLFHSFGFTYTLWFPLLHGASVCYHAQPLDARGLGNLIQRTKATFLPAPPTFCQAYLRGCTQEQFASLRHVLVGAEKLQPALAAAFQEKFNLTLLEGYGATEMSPVISVNVPDRVHAGVSQAGSRPGTVGQTVPGVAARVVHVETGEPVPAGQEGLLLVKGPNRMLGYLNRPAETEAVLRDGWYVTGDIVNLDPEGFMRIVDRVSRFSKIGGEMVPHGKIEEALQTVLRGAPCAVTAVADDRKGERLVAFAAAPGLSSQEIWQALQSTPLPKLWIPKAADIRTIDRLPVLGTGKLDLRAIKRLAAA